MAPDPDDRPPSIDSIARGLADLGLPHPLLVHAARRAVADGDSSRSRQEAEAMRRLLLAPVINATGVLLHTNLGRARWAVAGGGTPSNVEFDLDRGGRGDRQAATSMLLTQATGAEAGLVVNNGAAAVLLVLAALGAGGNVAVSRGELVEIGGGFRIPDVMTQSGARLIEVGTTNRTRAADFERAHARHDLDLVMVVHRSNFTIDGFTSSPTVAELAAIGPPVIVDAGSGLLDASCPWLDGRAPEWLTGEPGVRQLLDSGADIVIFSGDKLLGGPQSGFIVGRHDLVQRCATHPLMRAVRCGAPVLGAVQDLLLTYLRRDGHAITFWRQATTPMAQLISRAEALRDATRDRVPGLASGPTRSVTGGGTLPAATIDSWGLTMPGDLAAALRAHDTPVIARVDQDHTVLDLRTVEPSEDAAVLDAVLGAAGR